MKKIDFSLKMYTELCKTLQPCKTVTVRHYLSDKSKPPCIIMRHDVDRSVKNALAMAQLEHNYGIKSTYYFRYPYTFDLKVMKQIYNLGHEIGYHYEVLDKASGDCSKAIELFQKELGIFRKSFLVKTICMHGNPLTEWDGKDIWRVFDFKAFGILGEAYLSLSDINVYLTDTGRNWNGGHNFKDRLPAETKKLNLGNTADVIRFINSNKSNKIYFNCHPERWGSGFLQCTISFLRDHFFNFCKTILKYLRLVSKRCV
ncbi:MAG: hypothetical protein ACYCWE_04500 [Eubacteriales bacterium]